MAWRIAPRRPESEPPLIEVRRHSTNCNWLQSQPDMPGCGASRYSPHMRVSEFTRRGDTFGVGGAVGVRLLAVALLLGCSERGVSSQDDAAGGAAGDSGAGATGDRDTVTDDTARDGTTSDDTPAEGSAAEDEPTMSGGSEVNDDATPTDDGNDDAMLVVDETSGGGSPSDDGAVDDADTTDDSTSDDSAPNEDDSGVSDDTSGDDPVSSDEASSDEVTSDGATDDEALDNDGGAAGEPVTDDEGNDDADVDDVVADDDSTSPTEMQQEVLSDMPSDWQEHSVVALRGEVYVIGGFNPNATDRVVAYDPDADSWRDVEPFPEVAQHVNAAAIDDRIYVAGYYVGSSFSNVSGNTYAYDPDADEWTPRASMPAEVARSSACVAAHAGRMYLFGGANGGSSFEASVYDPSDDSWETLPPLDGPREHCTAGSIGDRIYIASGRSGGLSSFRETTLAFDPASNTYEELAPIPTPRGGTAGAVLDGKLYVFGGEGNQSTSSGVFPTVEAYDPTTDTWQTHPDMLLPRHGFGAATLNGRIYLPGGADVQAFGSVADHTAVWFE